MIPRFLKPTADDLAALRTAIAAAESSPFSHAGGNEAGGLYGDLQSDAPTDAAAANGTDATAVSIPDRHAPAIALELPNIVERAYLQGKLHVLFERKRELILRSDAARLLVERFDRALPMRTPATPPNGPIRVSKWLDSYRRFCVMTCAISVPDQYLGSGFLVGRNLVLTSRHVLRRLFSRGVRPEDVKCTFDQQLDETGYVTTPTDVVRLKTVLPVKQDPALDFVIMETTGAPGDTEVPSIGVRSWVKVRAKPETITPWLFVGAVHRPEPDRLLFSPGIVVGVQKPFVDYTLAMGVGSSGAPVFTLNWQLVAVHNRLADERDLELRSNGDPVDEGIEPALTTGVLAPAIYETIERGTGRPPENPPVSLEVE